MGFAALAKHAMNSCNTGRGVGGLGESSDWLSGSVQSASYSRTGSKSAIAVAKTEGWGGESQQRKTRWPD